jgi:2-dehydro-3-deoxygalactonokinase
VDTVAAAAEGGIRVSALLAIDWGTTSARAYRLDATGRVLQERTAPLGISQIQDGRYAEALAALLGDWSYDSSPRLACGMIGSRQGWVEAPYVACPASVDVLVGGLVRTPQEELTIVPGLITRDARGIPDVLRGEETQLAGAVEADENVIAILPGTHSKWVRMQGRTIVDFQTFMTGELYAVLLSHSILGRLAERSSTRSAGPAFNRGLQHGLATGSLPHDLFAARALALTGELAPSDVEPWLSGLLIGREIRDGLPWAQAASTESPVRVIGESALRQRYLFALQTAGIAGEPGPGDAVARGLWRIAVQAGIV